MWSDRKQVCLQCITIVKQNPFLIHFIIISSLTNWSVKLCIFIANLATKKHFISGKITFGTCVEAIFRESEEKQTNISNHNLNRKFNVWLKILCESFPINVISFRINNLVLDVIFPNFLILSSIAKSICRL